MAHLATRSRIAELAQRRRRDVCIWVQHLSLHGRRMERIMCIALFPFRPPFVTLYGRYMRVRAVAAGAQHSMFCLTENSPPQASWF